MHLRYFLAASAASLTLATAIANPAFAQETTSAIAGQVTDESGGPVTGAKVTVVHTPSGTRNTVTTDSTGSYSLRGLRIGGPYTVSIRGPDHRRRLALGW